MSKGTKRTRNYATVVYPDSENTCENWQDILFDLKIPAFISPLHDMDENPGGEKKKPHFHVVIMFEGVKTLEQAEEVFRQIGGVGCEIVQSIRGYARYLCHLDNPEKAQYKQEDVRCVGGADYVATIGLALDKYKAIGEMIDFCIEQKIFSYAALLNHCRHERFDWFRILCDSGTMVMREFLKSYKWTVENENHVDSDTGEILDHEEEGAFV